MKTIAAFLLALLLGAPLRAQETLLGGDVEFGGYGGPVVQFTSLNKQRGVLVGGGGGVVIGHTLSLGGAGYGLVNNVTEDVAPAATPYLNLGYGGVYLRYINSSNALVHFTAGVLIGGGGAGFRDDVADGNEPNTGLSISTALSGRSSKSARGLLRSPNVITGATYRPTSRFKRAEARLRRRVQPHTPSPIQTSSRAVSRPRA